MPAHQDFRHTGRDVSSFVSFLLTALLASSLALIELVLAVMSRIDPSIWKVAVALLTAQTCPHDIEGFVPVLSELVCWSLVLACLLALTWINTGIWEDIKTLLIKQSPLLWWITAASIAAVTVSFSFEDVAWIYVSIYSYKKFAVELTLRRTAFSHSGLDCSPSRKHSTSSP
jgi:hypothetical protein